MIAVLLFVDVLGSGHRHVDNFIDENQAGKLDAVGAGQEFHTNLKQATKSLH